MGTPNNKLCRLDSKVRTLQFRADFAGRLNRWQASRLSVKPKYRFSSTIYVIHYVVFSTSDLIFDLKYSDLPAHAKTVLT